jgi:hypothetical protein
MSAEQNFRIRPEYALANCCNPTPERPVVGFHSRDDIIKLHAADCPNLRNIDQERLIDLSWDDILLEDEFKLDDTYRSLEENDFRILALHLRVGLDYSHKVARLLHLDKQEVFDRHAKLRDMGLLRRVPKLMIRYRKGVVDNKWIKHRNHTYYELTDRGKDCAEHFIKHDKNSR